MLKAAANFVTLRSRPGRSPSGIGPAFLAEAAAVGIQVTNLNLGNIKTLSKDGVKDGLDAVRASGVHIILTAIELDILSEVL